MRRFTRTDKSHSEKQRGKGVAVVQFEYEEQSRSEQRETESISMAALATPTGVVLELMTMGQQSAAHLGELLRAATSPGEHQALTAEILRCCDRVIAALSGGACTAAGKKRKATDHGGPLPVTPSKRRARGAEEADREVESGTTADGFMWRKYGQKDINGCKHPRIYYRCAYRGQGCGATRRVQRSRDEPAAYAIAYYGKHTCGGGVACQQGELLLQPPTVVDSGVVGADRSRVSPPALLPSEQSACHDVLQGPGETSRGWSSSSSSSSSEVEFGASPVLEFLEGCFDWESAVNYLGSVDLPQIDTLQ